MKRTTRVLGAVAAGSALVLGGGAVAQAAPSPEPLVTYSGRTSTCPTEVSAEHPLCRVASFGTRYEEGRSVVFVELTTEAHDPDPSDRDGKTYLSDVLCDGPVSVRRRGSTASLRARFTTCDVALGDAPAGRYSWTASVDTAAVSARTRVNRTTYGYSLFAAVEPVL
ncbi:hypothetical protein GCM10027586_19310 [Kineococcus gypseus]|uniref:hypothetical protein n=1 Tax=Kineococcus gypseus TaxID=1637102 RepID=UPI003D7CC995